MKSTTKAKRSASGGFPVIQPQPLLVADQAVLGIRLISDPHVGAPTVDYGLLKHELDEARAFGDRVLLGGDIFDGIIPSDRRRYQPGALHPRLYGRNDIINAQVEWAEEIFSPYADLIDAIGVGNHETALEKNGSYDAVRDLVKALNRHRKTPGKIAQAGYSAMIQYRIRKAPEGRDLARYIIWYHHGVGKAVKAPVILSGLFKQREGWAADLYWSGHTHAKVSAVEQMLHVTRSGRLERRDQAFVVTGAYMRAYAPQSQESMQSRGRRSNYGVEAGYRPHGMGGAQVLLHFNKPGFPSRVRVVQ